jgi:Domain of unknown function (DUF5916)/Carbohydrate family 9 binding domain-like
MKYYITAILLFIYIDNSYGQIKEYGATAINSSIKIDGKADEAVWASISPISDFVVSYPDYGKQPSKKTDVKIAHDNTAIYIVAIMYDDKKNIRKQLSQRDAIDRQDCDVFSIGLDTYHDRQNAFIFQVTAAGVQGDGRQSSANGLDRAWDAVWESAVKIDADKWVAEIKIPFSAIRFAKKDIQSWGLQLTRNIRVLNESNTWSPQNPNVDGTINQWGDLISLKNIVPPLRLSFLPYLSGGVKQSPTSNGNNITEYLKSGGMDVKYGINESFTVDMTLIPDFAQVQSDNVFLNLTPFKVRFEDFRPFFTEGTELFNKAGLFYSRNIGATPSGTSKVLDFAKDNPEYKIDKNPGITRLYNATKFSGRTKNNVGIGIFNAVTAPMKAILTNDRSKKDTTIITEPLTNYNVLVFDKALKNRSSYTITNTNVMRKGNSRNANVTALDVSLFDKSNNHNLFTSIKYSNIWGTKENYDGFKTEINGGKISGKWQWQTGINIESDRYDPNDLGFLFNNNSFEQFAEIGLNYNTPTKKYLSHRYKINVQNSYLYKPFAWNSFEINANAFYLFKNFWDVSYNFNSKPVADVDFFESRTPGLKLNRFAYAYIGVSGSSDSRKKLFGSWDIGVAESPKVKDDPYFSFTLNTRYRFTDRFQLSASFKRESDKGQWGFSHRTDTSILVKGFNDPIIAFRKLLTTNFVLNAQYNFTPRMNWTIRMRHNWTNVVNRSFHQLKTDGSWDDIAFSNGRNRNFNVFNVDMFYTWDFKWGSRLTLGWKNAIGENVSLSQYQNTTYLKNFGEMFNNPHSNEVTVKVVYFLDYLNLKRRS